MIKKQNKPDAVPYLFLYHADQAIDLKADGLRTEPRLMHEKKFLWDEVLPLFDASPETSAILVVLPELSETTYRS